MMGNLRSIPSPSEVDSEPDLARWWIGFIEIGIVESVELDSAR